jgi:DNA modification methylase
MTHELHYSDDLVTLYHGDCRDVLATMPDCSVDAVVTDPPYELGFMGNGWDSSGIAFDVDLWRQVLRVLKPGGHVLAFGASRTWHRLAASIEDSGFEIRDSIAWLYGSGFPKSLDVSKAVDKLDASAERLARAREFQDWLRPHLTPRRVNELTGTDMGHHLTTHPTQPSIATADIFDKLRPHLPEVPGRIEELVAQRTVESANYAARAITGTHSVGISRGEAGVTVGGEGKERRDEAHTDEAKRWDGWGTALKPAFEPIVVGRKPLDGTVAANVVAHGTGAMNVDACRVGAEVRYNPPGSTNERVAMGGGWREDAQGSTVAGRWPTNVVLDGSQADELDRQVPDAGGATDSTAAYGARNGWDGDPAFYGDAGGASRFFPTFHYEAKAPKSERPRVAGVAHPTVKPLGLMRWCVRLITPPGGTVLEIFPGSGTTIEACILERFHVVAIEKEAKYLPLIMSRITRRLDPVAYVKAQQVADSDPDLFDLLGSA